jgi:hypothetical protein
MQKIYLSNLLPSIKWIKIIKYITAIYFCISIINSNTNRLSLLKNGKISTSFFNNSIKKIFSHKLFFFTQSWSMYSPNPIADWGIIKLEAITQNGKNINLISGEIVNKDNLSVDFKSYQYEKNFGRYYKTKHYFK